MTKDDLIKLIDRPQPSPVYVPEWDATVHVRRLTARERLQLENLQEAEPDDLNIRVAAMFLSTQDGMPFFDSIEEGVEILGGKETQAVVRIARAGYEANVFDISDVKKKSGGTATSNT